MGEAIVAGLCASTQSSQFSIHATARKQSTCDRLQHEYGIQTSSDNVAAMNEADVTILCVKPQMVSDLLGRPEVSEALKGKLLISICAGVNIAQLRALVPGARVLRAMPNTPALIREGMTVLSRLLGGRTLSSPRRKTPRCRDRFIGKRACFCLCSAGVYGRWRGHDGLTS